MPKTRHPRVAQWIVVAGLAVILAACAVAPPRTDDPLQKFNRKMYAFNRVADKVAIHPAAEAYVKVTGPKERVLISNFFANLRSPITVINDVLQGHPGRALETTGRFLVNTTVGFLGIFDPASEMKLPAHPTDFGVTLAHWGVPEGPYLVLPFIGPTTLRDVWRMPVDSYFDPMGWYARTHDFRFHAQYLPSTAYLVTLRAKAFPIDPILNSSFDPYAFMRDAYRQHRLYEIYYGNPPLSAIEELQGTAPGQQDDEDIDALLQQQQAYEQDHRAPAASPPATSAASGPAAATSVAPAPVSNLAVPAPASTATQPSAAPLPMPAPAATTAVPASGSSVAPPASH